MDKKFSFSFIRYDFNSGFDGCDYYCFYDVDEENGRRAYDVLKAELGHDGTMEQLLKERFGEELDGEMLRGFCDLNGIKFELSFARA